MREYPIGTIIRGRKVRSNPWYRLLLLLGFALAMRGTTVTTITHTALTTHAVNGLGGAVKAGGK